VQAVTLLNQTLDLGGKLVAGVGLGTVESRPQHRFLDGQSGQPRGDLRTPQLDFSRSSMSLRAP
jgi:hypothetical protein